MLLLLLGLGLQQVLLLLRLLLLGLLLLLWRRLQQVLNWLLLLLLTVGGHATGLTVSTLNAGCQLLFHFGLVITCVLAVLSGWHYRRVTQLAFALLLELHQQM
jgi:hypothetical protein